MNALPPGPWWARESRSYPGRRDVVRAHPDYPGVDPERLEVITVIVGTTRAVAEWVAKQRAADNGG